MALENPADIEALADRLAAMAEALHASLMNAIHEGGVDLTTAQAIFQQEAALRQKGNALYADAVTCVVTGLELEQKDLMTVMDAAQAQIQSIKDVQRTLNLIGAAIGLAASVISGNPGSILAALQGVRDELTEW